MKKEKFLKAKEEITIEIIGNHTKIYINNLIHIQFRCDDFIGIQSTIEGTSWYRIYLYLKSLPNPIICEYGSRERWESILRIIDSTKL